MNLNLERPLVFFDLETTGINVTTDRIVEISMLKVAPDGTQVSRTHRVNPEMEIPLETSEIHGIYNKDVAQEPPFSEIAADLNAFLEGCDLGGFNSNRFDVPLLAEEFMRVGVDFSMEGRRSVDVQTVFHKMEQRTLSAAYKFYCDKELVNAHSAEADTAATFHILDAQIAKYEEVAGDVDFLHTFTSRNANADLLGRIIFNKDGVECFNFGKHKGRPVKDVLDKEPGYFNWMMHGEFPLYTKKVLKDIKERG